MLNKISGNKFFSVLAALFFICHPAISEAVILITYNDDLLTVFFFLSALLLYVENRRSLIFLSYICFILALFSKEMAISLPAIVILYDFLLNRNFQEDKIKRKISAILREKIFIYSGYIIIAAAYVLFRLKKRRFLRDCSRGFPLCPFRFFNLLKSQYFPIN